MGDKANKGCYEKLKENYLAYLSVRFTIAAIVLYSAGIVLAPVYMSIYKAAGNFYLSSVVNKKPQLKRNMTIAPLVNEPASFEIITVFKDKTDAAGNSLAKAIKVDFRTEGYIPTVIFLALMFALPLEWRRKLKPLLIGFFLITIYIIIKLNIIAFDNYNNPESAAIELTGFLGSIVYHSNKFLNLTGFSSTIVIPLVVWIVVNIKSLFEFFIPTDNEN
jgi:hypothetical protein